MKPLASLEEQYRRLICIMEAGSAALERQDIPAVEACSRSSEQLVAHIATLFHQALAEEGRNANEAAWTQLIHVIHDAQECSEQNRQRMSEWIGHIQESLLTLNRGSAAITGYTGFGSPGSEKLLSARA